MNQYSFRLEGYNDNWNVIGNSRCVNLENISANEYNLHVRAANSNGVWNVEGVSIGITVLPPGGKPNGIWVLFVNIRSEHICRLPIPGKTTF